jgi:predicted PurR-regulated permease PerM
VSRRAIAATAIGALGVLIAAAVMPFLLGLLGAPILAVMFAPVFLRLSRYMRPHAAAGLVVLIALLATLLPVVLLTLLIVSELPSVLDGPGLQRVLHALAELRVGALDIGSEIAGLSGNAAAWLSRQAIGLLGSAAFVAVNMLIAFFGLFYLLLAGDAPWRRIARYLPFTTETLERLRTRFRDVTHATILGIGATALLQGLIVGLSFWLFGLDHPMLWGAITGIVSVLPILGSALVWLPGAVVLFIDGRQSAAIILFAIGFLLASNVDNAVRPVIFRRVSHIHPLIAVVGAFAGMRYFGLLGVLLGPLTLVYFLELVRAWELEAPSGIRSHRQPGRGGRYQRRQEG